MYRYIYVCVCVCVHLIDTGITPGIRKTWQGPFIDIPH